LQWEVKVVDQSCSGHGKYDSRRKPDSSDDSQSDGDGLADNEQNNPCKLNENYKDGLGKGTIRIYTNKDNGNILGFTLGVHLKNLIYYCPDERNLVVGRLNFN
jgi:hypothetical protein